MNEPAFPQNGIRYKYERRGETQMGRDDSEDFGGRGLTIRDYFAAKALAALITKSTAPMIFSTSEVQEATIKAYEFADAMLTERTKGNQE